MGRLENPKRVERLEITGPGVYENYLVDSKYTNHLARSALECAKHRFGGERSGGSG